MEVGLTFTLTVVGLFYLGFKADERYGTSPLWSLIGFGVGFLAGFYNLFLTIDGASKREKAKREAERDKPEDGGDAT